MGIRPGSNCSRVKRRAKVSKETKSSDKMVLLQLFNYQGTLTVGYHRQCSFYRRRLFAAYYFLRISPPCRFILAWQMKDFFWQRPLLGIAFLSKISYNYWYKVKIRFVPGYSCLTALSAFLSFICWDVMFYIFLIKTIYSHIYFEMIIVW